MKINEKDLAHFATSGDNSDLENWLWKKNDSTSSYQKRWCILKGNLFFYFEKKGDKEPIGFIVLENCYIELAGGNEFAFAFCIHFIGEKTRIYKFATENEERCTLWIKALSISSYQYLSILVQSLETDVENMQVLSLKRNQENSCPIITVQSDDSFSDDNDFSLPLKKSSSMNDILDASSDDSLDKNIPPDSHQIVRSRSSVDITTVNETLCITNDGSSKDSKSSKSKKKRLKMKKLTPKPKKKHLNNSFKNMKADCPVASDKALYQNTHSDESLPYVPLRDDQLIFSKLHQSFKEDIFSYICE